MTFVFLVAAEPCSGRVITVDDDGGADFSTIQAAIDDADEGDVVEVQPGTYTGDGNRDIDVLSKGITVRSTDPNDPCVVTATIIDCNGSQAEPHRGFYFHGAEGPDSVLDGLTIVNGYEFCGGGIYCYYASPTISRCQIANNSADYGGGIASRESDMIISNCAISGNSATGSGAPYGGGGFWCGFYSSVRVESTMFADNTAEDGGGLCVYSGSAIIRSSTFQGNSAAFLGGAIYNYGGLHVYSCCFAGNTAGNEGGAIYAKYPPKVIAGTFAGNAAASGNALSCASATTRVFITSGIMRDGGDEIGSPNESVQVYDSDIEGGWTGQGENNIDADPMFVRNPDDGGDGWGVGDNDDFGDLHLQDGSPCIDTGNIMITPGLGWKDIDGEPRVAGAVIDMGADEAPPEQVLRVTSPKTGDVFAAGSSRSIKWESPGFDGDVDIWFSSDGGWWWMPAGFDLADTGSWLWDIPGGVDSDDCVLLVLPSIPDWNTVSELSEPFKVQPFVEGPPVQAIWKTLGGDFQRPGLSSKAGPELGCVKWVFEADGPVSAGPTVGADGSVYVPCEDGNLYALDANGVGLWSYDINSAILCSPTIGADGTVYVAGQDGRFYAIDTDGNLRWTFAAAGPIYSSAAVGPDGDIYVCSQNGILYALGRDGSELWTFQSGGFTSYDAAILASATVAADGTIYAAGLHDPNLYALDANDGSVRWACDFGAAADPCNPPWPFASPVAGPNGTIYVTLLYEPNLYAVDPNSGAILWSVALADPCSGWFESTYYDRSEYNQPPVIDYHLSNSGFSEPVIGPDGTIYVNFDDPHLRAIDPNGTIRWVSRLGMVGGFTMTVGSDGLIYAASDDGFLCVVDPNGEELARFETDDYLSFPVIADDNTLIVSDANNRVWAFSGESCEAQPLALHRPADLNSDRAIGLIDLGEFTQDWPYCTDTYMDSGCDYIGFNEYLGGDINRDWYVDFSDFALLADAWLKE